MKTPSETPSIFKRIRTVVTSHRLGWAVLLVASMGPIIGLGYGHDFFEHYRRAALTGNYGLTTWLPYYSYWLIYPFALLPHPYGLAVWNLVNALGLGWLCRRWGVNPLGAAVVFPTMYMFGNGQIAGIIAAGVVLGLASNPLVAGIGLVILSIKPQLTIFLVGYILLKRWHWRLLVAPAIVFVLSLLVWGFWVPEWLASFEVARGETTETAWNVSYFPYSLILLPALWAFRRWPRVLLAITPLIMPYYAIYSLALLFALGNTWWLFLLTNFVSYVYISSGYTPLWGLVVAGLVWKAVQDSRSQSKPDPRYSQIPAAQPAES